MNDVDLMHALCGHLQKSRSLKIVMVIIILEEMLSQDDDNLKILTVPYQLWKHLEMQS